MLENQELKRTVKSNDEISMANQDLKKQINDLNDQV